MRITEFEPIKVYREVKTRFLVFAAKHRLKQSDALNKLLDIAEKKNGKN